jgi:glycosyltransferase involved in cell wall biosynthesis
VRVLMVNKYYRLVGGVERYISELTRRLQQEGHEVVPFSMADPCNDPTPYAGYFVSGIEFFEPGRRAAPWRVAERVIYSQEAYRKIARLIEVVRPDVAHVHNIYHYLSPSVLVALRRYGVPIVMTLHDYKIVCPTYSFWVRGQVCERCQGGRFYPCALRRCNHDSAAASLLCAVEATIHRAARLYEQVDVFVSPSRFLRQKHAEHGFAPSQFEVVPNFVNLADYTPRYDHEGYFLCFGRLTAFKGVGTLLQAVARLQPAAPLLIVGDGPARAGLEAQSAQLGLGGKVRFLGHQSGQTLKGLVQGARFVVVPSEWYENCPYAVLESFALGKPVLAADIGGIPELVEPEVNGLLFPPGHAEALADGLNRLLTASPSFLRDLGRAGRQRVEAIHNEEAHYRALIALYGRAGGKTAEG